MSIQYCGIGNEGVGLHSGTDGTGGPDKLVYPSPDPNGRLPPEGKPEEKNPLLNSLYPKCDSPSTDIVLLDPNFINCSHSAFLCAASFFPQ